MAITRRGFLGAGAAFGAFGRIFTAQAGYRADGVPNLKFGVISDIHIVNGDVATLEHTFTWYRDQDVDGVVIAGDMADRGLVSDLQAVADAWYRVFPDDKGLNGKSVEKLFVYGNHDWEGQTYSGSTGGALLCDDFAGNWQRIFNEPYSPVWMKTVKGYTFVGAHWYGVGCNGTSERFNAELESFYAAHATELAGSRPFFHIQHPHPKDTCYGSWAWGRDDGRGTQALSNFPNAIAFSGHSHYPLTDERSIWQGSFISIGTSSLSYTGCVEDQWGTRGYENSSALADQKVMPRVATSDGRQGILVSVYDDAVVIARREFCNDRSLGGDWVIPMPSAAPYPYDFDTRLAAAAAPQFAPGATATLAAVTATTRKGGVTKDAYEVSFPAAVDTPETRVHEYEVSFVTANGVRRTSRVLAPGFHEPHEDARVTQPVTCCVPAELAPERPFHAEVRPLSCWLKAGEPILSSTLEAPPNAVNPDEFLPWVEATGGQYIDTGILGQDGTKAEVAMSWTEVTPDCCMLGSRIDSGNTRFWMVYADRPSMKSFAACGAYRRFDEAGFTNGKRYVVVTDVDGTKVTHSVLHDNHKDYGPLTWWGSTAGFSTGFSMYAFACNWSGTAKNFCKARLYRMKIWQRENGNLVLRRDYRPCLKDGRAGLYDGVSQTIFYPVCGEFVYPSFPDATVDYVESDGTQFTDTGVHARTGLRAEADISYTAPITTDSAILGAWWKSNRRHDFWMLNVDANGIWHSHGTGWEYLFTMPDVANPIKSTNFKPAVLERYRFASEFGASTQSTSMVNVANPGDAWSTSRTSTTKAFDSGVNLYLFARNSNGAPTLKSTGSCNWLDISLDGVKVREFRPCVVSGVEGDEPNALYDRIEGKIYPFDAPAYAGTPGYVYETSKTGEGVRAAKSLASNGTHYIDTGIRGRSGVRVQGLAQWTSVGSASSYDFSLLTSLGSNGVHCNMLHLDQKGFWFRFGSGGGGRLPTPNRKFWSPGLGEFFFDVSFAVEDFHITIFNKWGDVVTTIASPTDIDADGSLYVFAANDVSGAPLVATLPAKARCYGLKIWRRAANGELTLLRDYVPCRKCGKYMLFDKVEGVLYPSMSGSGFTGGGAEKTVRPVSYLQHVESALGQYVDLGVCAGPSLKSEVRMQWAAIGDDDVTVLGSRGSGGNDRLYLIHECHWDLYAAYGMYQRCWGSTMAADTWYNITTEYENGSFRILQNDKGPFSGNITTGAPDPTMPIYLFTLNWRNLPALASQSRVQKLKLWKDGVLVRDCRAVMTSLGLATFYDAVSQRLMPLATGAFTTYGAEMGKVDGAIIFVR